MGSGGGEELMGKHLKKEGRTNSGLFEKSSF
jgi:hypothetical protein